jgi:hypothetical protein
MLKLGAFNESRWRKNLTSSAWPDPPHYEISLPGCDLIHAAYDSTYLEKILDKRFWAFDSRYKTSHPRRFPESLPSRPEMEHCIPDMFGDRQLREQEEGPILYVIRTLNS